MPQADLFQGSTRRILTVSQPRGDVDMPIRERLVDGFEPRINSCLADIDLLTSTYETDDYRPILMPVHIRDQELRLRVGESRTAFLALHKVRRLPQIPGALSFIENYNVLNGRSRLAKCFVAKMVNVLNERFDTFAHFAFTDFLAIRLSTNNLITSERFAKHRDKRPVAGK